jgi:uncharacterized repeat protein (TIGR01451 family)
MTHRFAAGFLLAFVALLGAAQPAHAEADGWRSKRSLPTPRRLLAAATEGGLVYTFGGCGSPCFQPPFHTSTLEETRVEVFDPAADAWTERRPIPAVFFGGAAAAPGDGRIYLAGGYLTGNLLLAYQPAADAWSTRAPMPTARYGLAVAALGGKLYAVGGSGPSAALEIYDPATDTWTAAAPMPTARVFLAAAALGGKLYAVGGSPDCCGGARTAAVEAFDPATGRWQTRASLPVALQVSAAAALDGKLYVFGGNIPGADSQRFTFEYDPAADAWTARTAMPTPRDQAPAAVVGGRAYVLGGSIHCHCSALGSNEEYDPGQPPTQTPTADLAIRLVDGLDEVIACTGPEITYTLTVRNLGPDPVAGAVVHDDLPRDLLDAKWCRSAPAANCPPSLPGPLDDRVDLAAGHRVVYTVRGTLSPTAGGTLLNVATVTPPAGLIDPDLLNNRATDRDAIRSAAADLAVTKTNSMDEVFACEETTYTITVENLGPCPVVGAAIRDEIPPQLEDLTWCKVPPEHARPAGRDRDPRRYAGCQPATPGPLDDTVDLPPLAWVTYVAQGVVRAEAAGLLTNTATVTPPTGVPDQATDADAIVHRTANLKITKTDGMDEVWSGQPVTYTITVTNEGPAEAAGAVVRDPLAPPLLGALWCKSPPGVGCTPSEAGPIVDLAVDLAAHQSVQYTVTATVAPDFQGLLCNEATVAPPPCIADPIPADNAATDCDQVLLTDCNGNGIADATDIADGTSEDVDGDGRPDECEIYMLDWVIKGTAQGGTVEITIDGFTATCSVMIATLAGDSAEAVAAALAGAVNADPCLSAQGIGAQAHETTLWIHGFLLTPEKAELANTDPGLEFTVPIVKIPTLSGLGLGLFASLLAGLAARRIVRHGRSHHVSPLPVNQPPRRP